jgi:hypothetical protein
MDMVFYHGEVCGAAGWPDTLPSSRSGDMARMAALQEDARAARLVCFIGIQFRTESAVAAIFSGGM